MLHAHEDDESPGCHPARGEARSQDPLLFSWTLEVPHIHVPRNLRVVAQRFPKAT
jgi:hypothetical protein